MGKHLESPPGGLPQPRDHGELGPSGTRHGPTMKSHGDMPSRPQMSSPTPDMMGPLFGHKPDAPGV